MATLYHFMDCPHCFKVRVYLAERGIEWHSAAISRGHMPPEMPALNPLRRLPVWVTEDNRPVFGANTIIDFLEHSEPGPRLVPEAPLRRARCWMADEMAVDGLLEPLIALDRDMQGAEPDAWNMKLYQKQTARIRRILIVFEQLLGDRQWLIGEEMTLADLSIALPLTILERFGLDLAALPGLQNLAERLADLPSVAEARKPPASQAALP